MPTDDEKNAPRPRRGGRWGDRLGSLREVRMRLADQQARAWAAGLEPDEIFAETAAPVGRTVPVAVKEAAAWSWRLLLIVAVGYLVVQALTLVPIVTVPFVIALLLTAVLGPVQRWLRTVCHIPHSLAAFLALVLGVSVIGLVVWFVGTQVSANAPRLAQQLVASFEQLATWARHGPLRIDDAQIQQYGEELRTVITRNQETLVSSALSTLSALSHVLAGALLLLLATFFLLRDGDVIWHWALSLLPEQSRSRIDRVGRVGWHTLGGFVRGQTIIALLHATTIYVVLHILGVPMAVALAVLIFVGSYIPVLGMTVTGALCILVSLIEDGPGAAIVVAITIVILVQAEAHLLQPLIMSKTVEVHPLGVAAAVLAGTTLGGIAGALFAVPLVAFLNATIRAANLPRKRVTDPGATSAALVDAPVEAPAAGAPAADDEPGEGSARG